MAEFRMPSLGADMEAGTLVVWRRAEGDTVRRGEVIAEVETDKGIVEVEVFASGVIERLLVQPGQKVPVGTSLAIIRDSTEPGVTSTRSPELAPPHGDIQSIAGATPVSPSASDEPRTLIAYLTEAGGSGGDLSIRMSPSARRRARGRLPVPETARIAPSGAAPIARRAISPAARRRAKELGVDLDAIATGAQGGVVQLEDVERAAASPHAHESARGDTKQRAMRRAIAATMSRSNREIPHLYVQTRIDMRPASDWLANVNASRKIGDRILLAAVLLKATALALRTAPELNARFEDDESHPCAEINLGFAIALRDGGLVAPSIRRVDTLTVDGVMQALKDLVARARAGSLRSSELTDTTFTVTSLGERGVETVLPLIHPPQVAILGLGTVVERPWVADGGVVARPTLNATLAVDHRASDGHRAALFLDQFARAMVQPEAL